MEDNQMTPYSRIHRNERAPTGADGSEAERERIKENMAKDWELYNGSELYEFNKKRFKEEQDN